MSNFWRPETRNLVFKKDEEMAEFLKRKRVHAKWFRAYSFWSH